jgi:hypothetical protein
MPVEPFFERTDVAMRVSLLIGIMLAIGALLYTWRHLPEVPLLSVVRGQRDPTALAIARTTSRLPISERPFFVSALEMFIVFLQMIALAAYCYWQRWRRTSDLAFFAVALVVTVLSLTYNISKAPLMYFLTGMMIAIVATRGSVSRWVLGAIGGVGLMIAIAMYVLYRNALAEGEIGLASVAYNLIAGRLATGQLLSFFVALDIFPRVQPHLWFSSTGRLIHEVLGLPFAQDYGLQLMAYIDPDGVRDGTAGHATSIFLGEAWANFGWLGLTLFPPLVGFLIQSVHMWFVRARKTPLHVGLYAYMAFTFTLTSGVQMFYYPAWLVQVLMVTLLFVGLATLIRLLGRGAAAGQVGVVPAADGALTAS